MKSPLDFFFKLGDKATKGDPKRKADYDYYMLWIMFIAFVSVFGGNLYSFITTLEVAKLGWSFVMIAILWFQYYNLKMMYDSRKLMKTIKTTPEGEEKVESAEEMMGGFKK